MGLFEWYFGLRPLVRLLVALVPLGLATAMAFAGRVWPWGFAVGGVMLACSLPTRGEKNKWGDW